MWFLRWCDRFWGLKDAGRSVKFKFLRLSKKYQKNQYSPLAVDREVLSCGVRARKALFYKDSAGSDFLSGSVKWCGFLRKWCSIWCSGIRRGI